MNDTKKAELRELLLTAIDAYKKLQEAETKLEQARAAFGYAKLYENEPRIINVDGQLWGVTVPFPTNRDDDDNEKKGTILFNVLGDFL